MEDSVSGRSVEPRHRRTLLRWTTSAAGLALVGCATTEATRTGAASTAEAEVTPGEDLMQEHGLLERILLIYDEAARRIEEEQPLDLGVLARAANLVRTFVEDYHEKLEEQFVFPRLRAAAREVALVETLLSQHRRGRVLTDEIVQRTSAPVSVELARLLRSFARMYRPHAAREETVLLPAFREVIGPAAYRELGERFEDKEHELFGEHGFEREVSVVAQLEAALAIHDLASFTPG